MAKQAGPYFITGTIGGISFYKSGGEYLVRRAGGPSRKKINTSPKFEITRYNLSEFAACSAQGAFLRRRLAWFFKLNDKLMYRRMTKMFTQLKNYDTASAYGKRCVSQALKTDEGKRLFCNFAFSKQPLQETLLGRLFVSTTKELVLRDVKITFPTGANNVVLSAVRLQANLEHKSCSHAGYTPICMGVNSKTQTLRLVPEEVAGNTNGNEFYFLQLKFYCNDTWFESGAKDVVGCIAIDPALVKEDKPVSFKGEQLPFKLSRLTAKKIKTSAKKITKEKKEAPA